ncbi:HAMP domain-containing protein [Candidatus Poribacteria bacterium]|nr:HAMP domain-containing protein [Candidatus Poribacteria bacterium]
MRPRFGITWKYFIACSAIATIAIFTIALLINGVVRDRYRRWTADKLKVHALLAAEIFKNALNEAPEKADLLAKEIGRSTGLRITLIDPMGTVLADSERDPLTMENHSGRPEIKKALKGEIGMSTRYSTTLGEMMSYVAVPVIEEGRIRGVVRVSLKTREVNLLIGEITDRVLLLSIIMWAVALALTFLFSSLFSSSVRRMVALTRKIAEGDFTARTAVRRRDELGSLAEALNEMARKLQSLFEQLQTRYDELNAILNSMSEGVLVLDRNLNVKLANNRLVEMFSVEGDITGRGYLEVIRCADLKVIVDDLIREGKVIGRRMKLSGRTFTVNGSSFEGEGGERWLVLVFHDITSDAQIERIKADFVANASHELRTPLTAIKGYLETLEDEEPETRRKFIGIIRRNVERMSNLVSDLLLLSRLESSEPHLAMERIDLGEISVDVMKLIEREAERKGIELNMDVNPESIIVGDPFLIEQMLLNLLDNAVKYTERGEVTLRIDRERGRVKIQVSDTGVGIPSEHLPRIFERFYRVDKARSRELGGTGLGLSIVKHIVRLHGGEIRVTSCPGSGTTFTVYLPPSIYQ